jgi:hypothetical protein
MNLTSFRQELEIGQEVTCLEPGQTVDQLKPNRKLRFNLGKLHHFGRADNEYVKIKKCDRSFATFAYVQGRGMDRWVWFENIGRP